MEYDMSVWHHYPKNDEKFTHPMFAPYQSKKVRQSDGQICPVDTWKKQDCSVTPHLVRKGWGLDFQLMHPDRDSCPVGWNKNRDGWCVHNQPEFKGSLYSHKAFVPKYQYFDGYTVPAEKEPCCDKIKETDMKSVNPWTGNLVRYFKPHSAVRRYGKLPSKDSFIS